MQRIHVFRAGSHTPMAGATLNFAEADLAATARAYDPAKHEAPIVVGHPKLDAPAYGWVGGLTAEGGDLFATPKQVEPAFADLVKEGRFKKVSVAFFKPDHPSNPTPGTYYLKHVGFLGATPPAVKGLKPIEFAADDADTLTVEFGDVSGWQIGWLFRDIAALFRGVRDHLVARDGVEAADKALGGDSIQRLAEEAARMQAEASSPVPAFSGTAAVPTPAFAAPPAPPAPSPEKTQVTEEELAVRERAIADREAAFAQREAEARKAEDEAFVAGLVKAGRLAPGLAPRVVAFMGVIEPAGEVAFAEGGTTLKETPRQAFRQLLSKLPQVAHFGEVAGGEGPGAGDPVPTAEFAGARTDPARLQLHQKAQAYQKAHPGTDYVTAVMAVEQAG